MGNIRERSESATSGVAECSSVWRLESNKSKKKSAVFMRVVLLFKFKISSCLNQRIPMPLFPRLLFIRDFKRRLP